MDTASQKRCMQFVDFIKRSCPGLDVQPFSLRSVPTVLTEWLSENDYPKTFCMEDSCVIKVMTEEGTIVRFKNQDLLNNEVRVFLEKGGVVTQMAVSWCDKIRFTLKEDFGIAGVKFLTAIKDLAKDGLSETAEDRFMADFFIMAETLQIFLQELLDTFLEASSKLGIAQA